MKTTLLCATSLAMLALSFAPAGAADPCSPPIREEREYLPGIYVVEYDYNNANYLFIYQESNTVPGAQTHFDVGAGCTTAEPDKVIWGTGGSLQPYVPLP